MIYGITNKDYLLKSSPRLRLMEQEKVVDESLRQCHYEEEIKKQNKILGLEKLKGNVRRLNKEQKKLYNN